VPAVKPQKRRGKDEGMTVGWITVTYRSVFMSVLAVLLIGAIGMYFAFPAQTRDLAETAGNKIAGWLGGNVGGAGKSKGVGQQKAQFTMIDGSVKVKKKSSNTWVNADYNLPLEKGDVVQTGSEGMAKIVFADLSNYTVKQDSLIVVEENSTTVDEKTTVAVQVTTGTVDLSTATYSQGSKSQVIVAGATATLQPESVAQVKNDPRADQSEILVTKGGGEVSRGGEVVNLSNYEKLTIKTESGTMTKTKEIGPPILIDPSNMLPVFTNGTYAAVRFTWTPMENSKGYHIQVAKNAYFTENSMLVNKRVTEPELLITNLPEGAYYWSVQSVDERGRVSVESERNRFTVIPKNTGDDLKLMVEPFIQHGRIIEVKGKTDASARVMVNGSEVPYMSSDGSFRYLTPPLPNGENLITVTAQNAKGGVNTQSKKVVIQ
jgi:hypothetical protein